MASQNRRSATDTTSSEVAQRRQEEKELLRDLRLEEAAEVVMSLPVTCIGSTMANRCLYLTGAVCSIGCVIPSPVEANPGA